jgi:hypothetical protein
MYLHVFQFLKSQWVNSLEHYAQETSKMSLEIFSYRNLVICMYVSSMLYVIIDDFKILLAVCGETNEQH